MREGESGLMRANQRTEDGSERIEIQQKIQQAEVAQINEQILLTV
jgi:hypothetical protein